MSQKCSKQHDIGCIVIEEDDGQVAGIVSERDLVRAIGQSGPKVEGAGFGLHDQDGGYGP